MSASSESKAELRPTQSSCTSFQELVRTFAKDHGLPIGATNHVEMTRIVSEAGKGGVVAYLNSRIRSIYTTIMQASIFPYAHKYCSKEAVDAIVKEQVNQDGAPSDDAVIVQTDWVAVQVSKRMGTLLFEFLHHHHGLSISVPLSWAMEEAALLTFVVGGASLISKICRAIGFVPKGFPMEERVLQSFDLSIFNGLHDLGFYQSIISRFERTME